MDCTNFRKSGPVRWVPQSKILGGPPIETIALTPDSPVYAAHGDDFLEIGSVLVTVGCEECALTVHVAQMLDIIVEVPEYPFLIENEEPDGIECAADTDFDLEHASLYSMRLEGLPGNLTLSLVDGWSVRQRVFVFAIYSPDLIEVTRLDLVPMMAFPETEFDMIKIGVNLGPYSHTMLVARRDQQIYTRGLDVFDSNDEIPCTLTMFAGPIPAPHDSSGLLLSRKLREDQLGARMNHRVSILSFLFPKPGEESCVAVFAFAQVSRNHFEDADLPISDDVEPEDFEFFLHFWLSNSWDYPQSSKMPINETRSFPGDGNPLQQVVIQVLTLEGGDLSLLAADQPQDLGLNGDTYCLFETNQILLSWSPVDDPDVTSRYLVMFQVVSKDETRAAPCFSETTTTEEVVSSAMASTTIELNGSTTPVTTEVPPAHSHFPLWTIAVPIAFLLILVLLAIFFIFRFREKKRRMIGVRAIQMKGRKGANLSMKQSNDDQWEFELADLSVKERIGGGDFANIHIGVFDGQLPCTLVHPVLKLLFVASANGHLVAIKTPAAPKFNKTLIDEIDLMKQIGYYPYILSLLGCYANPEHPMILLEYCEHGDLHTLLQKLDGNGESGPLKKNLNPITIDDFPQFAWEIAKGLGFLISKGVIHRDVAARNVLITADLVAKVCDFGLSRLSENALYLSRKNQFPIKWTAPEAIDERKFSEKSDVWSFGVLLWEMYSVGQEPYPDWELEYLSERLRVGYRLERPQIMPKVMADLMKSCWSFDAGKRPEFSRIISILEPMKKSDNYDYLELEMVQEIPYSL